MKRLVTRRLAAALCLSVLVTLQALGAGRAHAGFGPPPPPPTPTDCGPCGGPPPPPTPVKTLPSTLVPTLVYRVDLSPKHVRRGHEMKVVVTASPGDLAVIAVRYQKEKPVTYKGKADQTGTYVKTWTVPKTTVEGKASVKVTIASVDKSAPSPDPFVIGFTVTK